MPSRPRLPSSFPSSRGSVPASNHSVMFGAIRSRTKARTVSRIIRSSSVRSASTFKKSMGLGAAMRCLVVAISLPLQNARDFIEERFDGPLVGVFKAPPQQTAFGVAQRGFDAMLHGGFLGVAAEVKSVRPFKPLILNAPNDPLFGHSLLKNSVEAVMPFFRFTGNEGPRRTHKRLSRKRPHDIVRRAHVDEQLKNAAPCAGESAFANLGQRYRHGHTFARRPGVSMHSGRPRLRFGSDVAFRELGQILDNDDGDNRYDDGVQQLSPYAAAGLEKQADQVGDEFIPSKCRN